MVPPSFGHSVLMHYTVITMVTFVYLNIQLNIRYYEFITYTGFIESVYFVPRPLIVYLFHNLDLTGSFFMSEDESLPMTLF